LSASTVMVPVWPVRTLPISDSLSGTTSSIEPRSLSTAKELEDEPLEELVVEDVVPVEEAPASPLAEDPLLLEEDSEEDGLLLPPPDTVSPTSPESVTIVPLLGAYSLVSATACSSLLTASLSLFTAAFAEARFASRVAELWEAFSVV
jgi:hypothetical protein